MDILLVTALKIRLIPATPLEPESGCRDQLFEALLMAFWAFGQGGITHLLHRLQLMVTGLATILINRHFHASSILEFGNQVWLSGLQLLNPTILSWVD